MSRMRIFLFGKCKIEVNGFLMPKIESSKAEELLIYLLLGRERPQSRGRIADALWSEISQDQANAYLRKALWQLQSALEQLKLGGQGLLLVEGEWLQINPLMKIWLDIAVFEDAFKKTQGIMGTDLEETQTQMIQHAVGIYRGDLLDGWYQDWCLYERERLQHLHLAMLDKLMDSFESHGAYEDGLILGERILQHDQARERTHRKLMRLYYLAGDRSSALRQYRKCMLVLREELDVDPAESTRRIYEQIRADQLDSSATVEKTRVRKPEADSLQEVFRHLKDLYKNLNEIQKLVMQDMHVIQRAFKED